MKLIQKFTLLTLFSSALLSAIPGHTGRGDWTSSGAPQQDVMPPADYPILKCRDAGNKVYLVNASADQQTMREFLRGQWESLSGQIQIYDGKEITQEVTVEITKSKEDGNLFRMDTSSESLKEAKKKKMSIPASMLFRKGFGGQSVKLQMQTPKGYQVLELRCSNRFSFLKL